MAVTVRKTTNVTLLRRLDRKIMGKADSASEEITLEAAVWWLAEVDGRIAGYAGLSTEYGYIGMGYLSRSGILKEFRGKGIQKTLIQVRDEEAIKRGYELNITYVANWNHASANSLIRCGYTLYEPELAYGLKNALYFRKQFKKGKS